MAFFSDLTPYTYFPGAPAGTVNIGWLDFVPEFPTGNTSKEFRDRLEKLCDKKVLQTRGPHFCSACHQIHGMERDLQDRARAEGRLGPDIQELRNSWNKIHNGIPAPFGSAEIRVPGKDNLVFAAPEMIAHYVIMHKYCPPEEFIEAVLACENSTETASQKCPAEPGAAADRGNGVGLPGR